MIPIDILKYIGTGRENAVTREALVRKTGLSDRKVRKLIAEARREGEIIINAQDGAGYYRSDELGDLKRQYKSNHNRAMRILVQQKYLRRRIKEKEADYGRLIHDDTRR